VLRGLVPGSSARALCLVAGEKQGDRALELLVLERRAPSAFDRVRPLCALASVLGRQDVSGGAVFEAVNPRIVLLRACLCLLTLW
jgi:hypothetical protein